MLSTVQSAGIVVSVKLTFGGWAIKYDGVAIRNLGQNLIRSSPLGAARGEFRGHKVRYP